MFYDPKGRIIDQSTSEHITSPTSSRSPFLPSSPKSSLDFFSLTSPPHRDTKSLFDEEKELGKQFFAQEKRPGTTTDTPYVKIMKRCSALQKDVTNQWTDATSSISARREEWVEAKRVFDTMKAHNPWKNNPKYTKMRILLESRLTQKSDPAKELDKEMVLRLASPTASLQADPKRRYISLSDITPRRLEFLAKAKRGFGMRPLSIQELVQNLNKEKEEGRKWECGSDGDGIEGKLTGSDRVHTEPAAMTSSRSSPVNDFIFKQRNRFLRNPVSRLNIERKQAVEAAMQKISPPPEIARKAKRIEAKERQRNIKFLRSKMFCGVTKRPDTPIEIRELKAEIVTYRKNAKEEMTMDRRVRKSILLIRD